MWQRRSQIQMQLGLQDAKSVHGGRPTGVRSELGQVDLVFLSYPAQGRGGDEHPVRVGAAMGGELAMRTVHRSPLFDQLEDRLDLPVEQPVHRIPTGCLIDQRADMEHARPPTMHPHVRDEEYATGALVHPTLRHGVIYEFRRLSLTSPGPRPGQGPGSGSGPRFSPHQGQFDRELLHGFGETCILPVEFLDLGVAFACSSSRSRQGRRCSGTRPWRPCEA